MADIIIDPIAPNTEGMPGVAAGHAGRLKAVEFISAFLTLSPVGELLLGPGFTKRPITCLLN